MSSDADAPDFRALFEDAPGSYLVLRADAPRFTVAGASDAYLAATMLTREETLGRSVFEVLPDANPANPNRTGLPNLRASLEAVVQTRAPQRMAVQRYDIARRDGTCVERHWASLNVPVLEPGGVVRYILHHVEDVTERVLHREAAEAAERRTARLLERMTDAYLLLDADFRVVDANPAAERVLGVSKDSFLGRTPWAAWPASAGSELERQCRRAVAEQVDVHFAHHYVGGNYDFHLEIDAYPTDEGGLAVFWRDVTARVRAEADRERLLAAERAARAEAEAAREESDRANRAKGEFLAVMSHELRTPLNAIGGYAELMELGIRGPVTEQQRVDLGRIRASQHHLLGLINGILDLAKVDAGEFRVERSAHTVGATVDAALALVRPQAAAKALSVSERCAGAADLPYLGDEVRVRQVLLNLLANAVKFTPAGGCVAVSCAVTDKPPAATALTPGTPYVALQVEDTGIGIPTAELERIFQPFTQVDGGAASHYTRTSGGTGLGLTISRRLARLMGGDLTVESRVRDGSTFTLWLPTPERRAHDRADRGADTRRRAADSPAPAPVDSDEARALARIGGALLGEVTAVLHAWVERLRTDARIALPPGLTDRMLENHAATLVTDVALALRVLAAAEGEPAFLLRDGTAIQGTIAERHGAQRARLGWAASAVERELTLLGGVIDETIRRVAGPASDTAVEQACAAVAQLLAQATRISVGAFRAAAMADGT